MNPVNADLTAPTPSTAMRRHVHPNLDLVRAIAVLCVFFAHLGDAVVGRSELAWHFGQLGVLIFFVHTSLVLMQSLDRSSSKGAALFREFYLRRAFRLYPLSIVCVTVAMVSATWNWPTYVSNVLLTFNLTYHEAMWGGLWTLPLEVQMYVALPFLLFLGGRSRSWALAAWCVAVVLGFIQPHVSGRLNVIEYAPCFVSGVIAWRTMRSSEPTVRGIWWPLVFVATWSIWLLASRDNQHYYRWTFCLALALAIPWFQDIPRWMARLAAPIATYSYGIYLSHIAIIHYAVGLHAPALVRSAVLVALVVAVPIVVFHGIEDPMIRLGRRITQSRTPQRRVVSAALAPS
jgi:peptidoglycan/LPS O-acetylase OafA/YrhL